MIVALLPQSHNQATIFQQFLTLQRQQQRVLYGTKDPVGSILNQQKPKPVELFLSNEKQW